MAAGGQQHALDRIWEQHRDTLLGRAGLLRRAANDLRERSLGAPLLAESRDAAHQLSGTLGTFGFADASESARGIDALLNTGNALAPADAERIDSLLDRLYADIPAPRVDRRSPPVVDREVAEPRTVLFIDDDDIVTERLSAEAARRGMIARVASSPSEARLMLETPPPDVVVLDLTFEDTTDAAYELLAELVLRFPLLPVLVFTVRDSFTDRIEAARRGASGFLEKTLTTSDAMDVVVRAIEETAEDGTRVLAVDDDPAVLDAIKVILETQGHAVTTLQDPLRLWDELRRVSPALLLLDVHMPGVNGIELCRVLRNDPRWAAVPVLILTALKDSETVQRVFAAGADDYLLKPIVEAELVARVQNRLDRSRLQTSLADNDTLTGLANRRTSGQALSRLLRMAQRVGDPLCVAELDLDHFKAVNDRHGHAVGDAVLRRLGEHLRRSVRGEDLVARWGGEEFVVGMYGLDREAGVRRIGQLLERFRADGFDGDSEPFFVTFSAGVAQYPRDGNDIETLYNAADEALYRAKSAGRNRVMSASDAPDLAAETIDIAVVEDDPVIADVIASALAERGHSFRRFADGSAALAALGGTPPALRPRVILLDIELPGIDGFELLARLRDDGALRATKVLVITSRSSEADVLRALELGATDHVPKPFSVPVLLQKVDRALER